MTATETITAAQKAAAAADWSTAAALFETAYQATQTATLNEQLVNALVQTEKYTPALTYAMEFEAAYLANDTAATLYLTAALGSHQLIDARIFVAQRPSGSWQTTAFERITAAEATAEETLQATLTTTMRQFYHLSELPVPAQTERLHAAKQLTLTKYLTAAQFLLVDPFLHQLTRVEVLYTLHELRVTQPVDFIWLDGTKQTVVPADLPALAADATSQQVVAVLQQPLAQQDASLTENLQAFLPLQLMYLYPFSEKAISDAEQWVQLVVADQMGALPEKISADQQKMLDIQHKIQQLNLDLG
ncbi:hypothetical protein [Lactiplantibacillus fabifermentans]|uniref:TPR repeat-containing protein n=2 Tax=Lactiplantibacillus fabifermentans TaxID=483011 RepID=A0A0R2NRL5_9LACO|nr:hypothetical protein [Lactiplantibacillus fabifermentans]ETY73977.1 hypothetical protein LFAB_09560 [Lactiplantibacillus fabifermentans T30PCM01]KRO27371.1 hypothetical protein DY78_GL000124 [Lactiplantibacillus fabifermentans DSM 21115]